MQYKKKVIIALKRILAIKLPKGFTNKISIDDLRDAYNYAINNLKEEFPSYPFDFLEDNESVKIPFKFKNIEIMEPEEVEDISAFTQKPKGWLRNIPQNEWETELKEEYERDFKHILNLRDNDKLAPAIILGNEFEDGRARNLMQYALDEKTPVAIYVFTGKLHDYDY